MEPNEQIFSENFLRRARTRRRVATAACVLAAKSMLETLQKKELPKSYRNLVQGNISMKPFEISA